MTTKPCPSWCEKPAGHPFERGAAHPYRWHTRQLGDGEFAQLEEARGGDTGLDPVRHPGTVTRWIC
jgi:hypothetical protein